MPRLPSGWNALLAMVGVGRKRRNLNAFRSLLHRPLRMELLEDRRVLAIIVDTFVDESDGSIEDGDVSLRDAVFRAPFGEEIRFASSLNNATIELDHDLGEIAFDKSLTIDASMLPDGITIDGQNATPDYDEPDGIRLFNITESTSGNDPPLVTFNNLTFTGGDPGPINGGAISSQGLLVILNSKFLHNVGQGYGGAIFVGVLPNGTTPRKVLRILDSLIEENKGASGGGVAVAVTSATWFEPE